MENLSITAEIVRKQAKKIKNWTAPGKDEVHGYWLKHLTEFYNQLARQMNTLLQAETIEERITGKTSFSLFFIHSRSCL